MQTLAELQSATGYTSTHLYREARDGRIAGAVKIDGVWRVPASTITEWVARVEQRRCRQRQRVQTGRRARCQSA